ncbi:MAG: MFS transporter [Limnochordaceae bacterium]|nr:MFS transporter [Limnochordaceae bacterium]
MSSLRGQVIGGLKQWRDRMEPKRSVLLTEDAFLKLWTAQAVSTLGSQITFVALPLTAAAVLGASPAQMGLLGIVEYVPFILFGLLAGAWVDRLPRRAVMVVADLVRAAILVSVPAAALAGRLTMEHLYIVAFVGNTLTAFFDAALQAYVPSVVRKALLIEANSMLQVVYSLARIAGPALAGLLSSWFAAPLVITLDAVSFLISAILLSTIRATESTSTSRTGHRSIWHEIGAGLSSVWRNPMLLAIAGSGATFNLFHIAMGAVFILFLTQYLHLDQASVGMIFAVSNIGSLVGAALAGPVRRRLELGTTLIISLVGAAVGRVVVSLSDDLPFMAFWWLLLGVVPDGPHASHLQRQPS